MTPSQPTRTLQSLGTVLLTPTPRHDAPFYTTHLGFQPVAELDWYVSLQHPDLPNLFLDLMQADHPAAPESLQGQATAGLFLALVVTDAHAEARRLRQEGVQILKDVTDEPWGQRRFQVQAPGGVVVEFVQRIPPDEAWIQANLG